MQTYHLIVLLAVAGLSSSVLEVVPLPNLVTQGNTKSPPTTFTLLSCIVRPPQYTVTWLHAGTALSSMGKYSIQNTSIYNEITYGSLLTIQLLSYTDAGNYTCVVKPSPANGSESYSATIQLILLVKLEVLGPTNIIVNVTTTFQVELSCEMSQYIHPDGDLWWYRGGQRLDITQSKYSIGYRKGNKFAQNGGSNVTISRVSVLTISQLTSSDSGVYTCRLFGTDQSEDVNLTVVGGIPTPLLSTDIGIPTPLLSTDIGIAVGVSVPIICVVSFSMGVLVTSVLCYISRRSKESSPKPSSHADPSIEYDEVGTNGNMQGDAMEMDANIANGSRAMEMDANIAYESQEYI